jgi:hypothetical protein
MIVAASLLAGLLAAFALVAGAFAGGPEHEITGAILLGVRRRGDVVRAVRE